MPENKILLLSYVCSPFKGSEEGAGWNRVIRLARFFETHVLVGHADCFKDIQTYLQDKGDVPNLYFHFVRHSKFEYAIMGFGPSFYIGYNLWHRRAYRVAKELHKSHGFSLAHMMVFCGFREPGYLWKLPIPFFWGPLGGVQNYPWRFLGQAGIKGAITEGARTVANALQLRMGLRVRSAMKRAKVVMAANNMTAGKLKSVFGIDPGVQVETGIIGVYENAGFEKNNCETLNILWSGVLEHNKALQLLLLALSKLPDRVNYKLRVLGKGPLEKRWRSLADKLGIAENIKWVGWLPHEEALGQYDWAHVFIFTSLRDTTGTVVLESLSHGTPVICLDHQGAADIVTKECGIKAPVNSPADAVRGIADALALLHDDKEKRVALAQGALARARDFLWEKQTENILGIYNSCIQEKTIAFKTAIRPELYAPRAK